MPPFTKVLSILGVLLLAIAVSLNHPVVGYIFLSALLLSYVICSLTQVVNPSTAIKRFKLQ